MRSVLAGACASKEEGGLGLRAFVINFRGCEFFDFLVLVVWVVGLVLKVNILDRRTGSVH